MIMSKFSEMPRKILHMEHVPSLVSALFFYVT